MLRENSYEIYVTGKFPLDPSEDIGRELNLNGVVRLKDNTPYIEAGEITLRLTDEIFSLENFSIGREIVEPGESNTISVEARNTGDVKGIVELELELNEEIVDNKSITLTPGETKPVSFTISKEEAGTYSVSVGDQSGSFEVKKPPKPFPWTTVIAIIVIVIIVAVAAGIWYWRRTQRKGL